MTNGPLGPFFFAVRKGRETVITDKKLQLTLVNPVLRLRSLFFGIPTRVPAF